MVFLSVLFAVEELEGCVLVGLIMRRVPIVKFVCANSPEMGTPAASRRSVLAPPLRGTFVNNTMSNGHLKAERERLALVGLTGLPLCSQE